jgi:peptide/nickel transport system substrate-binding protein
MQQRSSSRPRLALAVVAAAALGLTACTAPQPVKPQTPTTLTIGWAADLLTLDPPNESGTAGIAVLHNVYETLVSYDFASGTLKGELATKWEISDDGRTYTFHLAEDAVFANGKPVTADDVLFSFQRVVDWPEAIQGGQIRPALAEATLTALDDKTVQITLAAPSASFLPSLAGTAASIISKAQVVEAAGENVEAQRAWLNENTAGSGPYQVTEWVPNSYITLGANKNWWAGTPTYESVEVRSIQESSQQQAALQRGDINVAMDLLPQQVKSLTGDFNVLEGIDLSTYYLALNLAFPPFEVPQVREAIKWAIDYDNIINGLLAGKAKRAGGVVAEGLPGFDASLADDYSYDPEKAKKLLQEAGYANGFSFDLYYVTGDSVRGLGVPLSTLAEKIQADLADIGITVNVVAQDLSTLFTSYRAAKLPALIWYFGSTIPDPDQIVSAHGDWNTQATTRVTFNDPTITEKILQARVLTNTDERAAIYKEVGERLSEIGPYVFMFRPIPTVVTTPGVTGFTLTPIWSFNLS